MTYHIVTLKDRSKTKNNVYVVVDHTTKEAAIIDPACDMDQIEQCIRREQIKITTILLTHSHADHIRRVNEMVSKYNCNVYIARKEAEYYGYHCENMILVEDREVITIGETDISCMLTPGHTVGSMSYLLETSFFSGDTLFIEGCGLCSGEGGSVKDMFATMNLMKRRLKSYIRIYPGHTYCNLPGQTFAFVRDNNIYLQLEEFEEFEMFRNRPKQTHVYDFI